MLTAIGRASVQRVLVRGSALAARRTATATPSFVRAVAPASRTFTTSLWSRSPDAAEKPATKTKKAKTTTTAKKTTAAKKPKAAAKKPAVKKAAPKPKAKKVKKELTPEEKLKKEIKELKIKALIKEQPKMLPDSKWMVFCAANIVAGVPATKQVADVAKVFRTLSEAELQSLGETAAENRLQNDANYKAWVASHTPNEINDANNARRLLRRRVAKAGSRSNIIRDERQPKRPMTPFVQFVKARWASGELTGRPTDVAKQVAEEFRNLDPAARKVYDDITAADLMRYTREAQETLGREVKTSASPEP
ncbi:hypothetical protein F5X68DRAFT_229464 [Plectosphaerella plurivora]|uniref:HMG box domain-containing protein n=1 Tax=Plectosphaerella plurivora TaxID=936078 RepID=A0A9P8VHX7_9PEZI|nr:hypothetical protein F5X68DRAFT_229464 [Plectosphaerella plurivora]